MSAQVWAALAATTYLTGLVVLVGVRMWRHRRATGVSGFNGFARRAREAVAAEVLFVAAVGAGALAPVLAAAGVASPIVPAGLVQPLAILGLLLVAAGLVTAWASQSAMGASWRIGVDPAERTSLVTAGVFARVRNPIFSAMVAAQSGTTLMAPTWLAMAGLVTLVLSIELQVRLVEEPYLRRTHGREYEEYTRGVGRFVPGIGRSSR